MKARIDRAQTAVIDSGGERLVFSSGLEPAKLNIGDYGEMKNVGGHSPGALREVVNRSPNNSWTVVSGAVGQADFLRLAEADAKAEGRALDYLPHRRFTEDDQLIRHDNKTYALTNQWGAGTEEALRRLTEVFPRSGIEVLPNEGE